MLTRRDFIAGTSLSLTFFALYWLTCCPTVAWYDSAEFATAAAILGIPHPPGYPLYTLVGHLFVRALPLEPALAVNLMSGFFGALAVGLTFGVCRALGCSRWAAGYGAALLGTGRLFWEQAVVAEVYTPGIAGFLVVLLLLLHGLKADRALPLVAAAGLAGLCLGLHLMLATCGLGLGLWVLTLGARRTAVERGGIPGLRVLVDGQTLGRRLKVAALCLGAALLGSCIFVYLPLRSSMEPELNFGQAHASWSNFIDLISGGAYKGWFGRDITVTGRASALGRMLWQQLWPLGAVLTVAGALRIWRRASALLAGMLLMIAGNTLFFFSYSVHDWQVFFLPTVTVLVLLSACGAEQVGLWLERAQRARGGGHLVRIWRAGVFVVPLVLLTTNIEAVDRSDDTEALEYVHALGEQLPRGAALINFTDPVGWKYDSAFGYYQMVLKKRRDVVVVKPTTAGDIVRLMRQGRAVYLFQPAEQVARLFYLRPEGVVYRVGPPRQRPATTRGPSSGP